MTLSTSHTKRIQHIIHTTVSNVNKGKWMPDNNTEFQYKQSVIHNSVKRYRVRCIRRKSDTNKLVHNYFKHSYICINSAALVV